MAINPALLIAAPMLQDYIVDKDTGTPLVNGKITLYDDNNRTNLKNWYYQTGTAGSYTYITLANPLFLSSVGTIQDPYGNDIIPFYYPFDEDDPNTEQKYYITVYATDENSQPTVLQFTRENFPPISNPDLSTKGDTLRNYIINNVYWRNCGSLDCTNITNAIVAPSQHDGYNSDPSLGNSDIRFLKNITGSNDSIAFLPMDSNFTNGDPTPEYFLRATCTAVRMGLSESQKCIQYPIQLRLNSLNTGVNVNTFVIYARNVNGASNPNLTINLYQYTGSANPELSLVSKIGYIVLSNTSNEFTQYTISILFIPTTESSASGDDAWFIQVQYPLNSIYSIDHTKPQLYLSETIANNDFDTYDEINSIISSPRTGDIRTSLNNFAPFGYIPMNDGTIGNKFNSSSSNATTRANVDTWQLFNLIWQQMSMNQSYAPMYDSSGNSVAYGANSIADWNAFNQISLTKSLGRVLTGTAQLLPDAQDFTTNYPVSNTQLTLITNTASEFGTGTPVFLITQGGATLPPELSTSVVYYSLYVNHNTIQLTVQPFDNTPITFSANSTGTCSIEIYTSQIGVTQGSTAHFLGLNEIPNHVHTPSPGFSNFAEIISAPGVGFTTGGFNVAVTPLTGGINGYTSQTSLNLMQPSTAMNVFIKL